MTPQHRISAGIVAVALLGGWYVSRIPSDSSSVTPVGSTPAPIVAALSTTPDPTPTPLPVSTCYIRTKSTSIEYGSTLYFLTIDQGDPGQSCSDLARQAELRANSDNSAGSSDWFNIVEWLPPDPSLLKGWTLECGTAGQVGAMYQLDPTTPAKYTAHC